MHTMRLQACGLVPIVEPELLIDGTHSIKVSQAALERVLHVCIAELWKHGVLLEGMLLKPQMVMPGAQWAGPPATSHDIALHTLQAISRCGPHVSCSLSPPSTMPHKEIP